MKNLKVILALVLILGLGYVSWIFFKRGSFRRLEPDPYSELRAQKGEWSEEAYDASGMWVILGQLFPDEDRQQLDATARAFLKGYNIQVDTWTFKSVLADDFDAFLEGGYTSPLLVEQGEFLPT